MSSVLPGPPIPQPLSPSNKSLNEQYDAQREKTYAATPQGKSELVYKDMRIGYLFKITVYSSILFFVLSNSYVFYVVNKLVATFTSYSQLIVNEVGVPTLQGNLIHTCVFFVCIMILLFLT